MRKPPFLLAREQILAFIPDFISVERYFDEILSAQANAYSANKPLGIGAKAIKS
jgi:hypothetical protein